MGRGKQDQKKISSKITTKEEPGGAKRKISLIWISGRQYGLCFGRGKFTFSERGLL
jgi:hypothetical protein